MCYIRNHLSYSICERGRLVFFVYGHPVIDYFIGLLTLILFDLLYISNKKSFKRHSWTNIKGDQMLKKLLKKNIQYI